MRKKDIMTSEDFDDGVQRKGFRHTSRILRSLRSSDLTRSEQRRLARSIIRTSKMPKSTERIHSFFALPPLGRHIMRRLVGR